MIIELSDIGSGSKEFRAVFAPEDLDLGRSDVALIGGVQVEGRIAKREAVLDASGTISFSASVECSRCLKPVARKFEFDFAASYVTADKFGTEREQEISGDQLSEDVILDDRIDVAAVAREQILLELPAQLLCTEDCRGLCPQCGADRNLINCACNETDTDPRWAALKGLK